MKIDVAVVHVPIINFSMQQNHVPIVREIIVKNTTEEHLSDISVNIDFDPDFAETYRIHIASIPSGSEERLTAIPIKLSTSFLSDLTERILGQIRIEVNASGQTLFTENYEISLLAFDQWGGLAILPEMLSAFVTPNHPAIAPLVKRASEILEKWTGSPSLDEYQTRDPDQVKKQMAAFYEAISEQQIAYCSAPASFEEYGQRVRLYDAVLSNKMANCLDMTLLYAGCLEAIGIHPLIVVIKGHAFAGGWLIPDSFADSVNDDSSLLTKRTAEGINEILLVETTCMHAGSIVSFDAASEAAERALGNVEDFLLFIDVTRARFAQLRPLPLRVAREGGFDLVETEPVERDAAAPASLSATDIIANTGRTKVDKQTIWERKLLDLSLRNNLLNTRITKNTLQLISVRIHELEDALSDGQEFQVLAKPADWDNPFMSAGIYQALHASDPINDLVKQELKHKRLRAYLNEEALRHSLTHLYRSSRLSLEENGANTLYLALGFLKWLETPSSTRPRFAPILLFPIEIVRKSASKGYVIRSRGEETMLNITLLEMLRQYFGINIGELEPLPRDESGVDVSKILNTVRRAIMFQTGWDVEEQAIIGSFSFSKFIMWNDIHNNADKLCRNKIVASLMTGKVEWDMDNEEPETADFDEKYPVEEIALPISADSSQLEAVCSAIHGKSFILHGPPGTGKSQTITNIIANTLYKGKRVLFVAEKMAALQVVQRRLESIGLAPFCLELHSNKTKKSSVLEQLKRTTEVVKRKPNENFQIEADRINALRSELNGYVNALHKPYPAGFSLYDCFAGYAFYENEGTAISLSEEMLSQLTPEKWKHCQIAAEEYQTAAMICGNPYEHPLTGVSLTSYNPSIKTVAARILKELSGELSRYRSSRTVLLELLKYDTDELSKIQDQALMEIAYLLLHASVLPPKLVTASDSEALFVRIDKVIQHGERRDFLREKLLTNFDRRILSIDVEQWQMQWQAICSKWWLLRIWGQSKLLSKVRLFSKTGSKPAPEAVSELFVDISAFQAEQKHIESYASTLSPILDTLWNNGECDWQRLKEGRMQVEKLNRAAMQLSQDFVQAKNIKQTLFEYLENGIDGFRELYVHKLERFVESSEAITDQLENVHNLLQATLGRDDQGEWLTTLETTVERWSQNLDRLRDWAAYNLQRGKAVSCGLDAIVAATEAKDIFPEQIAECCKKSFFKSYAEYILLHEPRMSTFHSMLFEEKILRFKRLCKQFEQLTREELFAKLAAALPALQKEAAQSSEVGILQRNIRNGGRGISIRKLFDLIPGLLTRMCPCMLMSPISVAQYIDIGGMQFDLVIFDEASQMPTCEAVGAIARGQNVIVVGDPKQMPPTSFFSTNTYDEDNADKEDLESILDDCLALSIPSKYLLWHYRSKHESLIAFSNIKYYDNKLLTFPSPDDLATKVQYKYVEGVYDRGRSRQNRAEAEAVIAEIKYRLSNPELAKRSIGVVTFNTNQQSLIEDMLTDLFRDNSVLEAAAMECEEPVFIKNLENVQGDERDVILFSVGYGPDVEGKIALNFGPLNREGGWRRLNVAVSRARYEMKVFSTLRADQIDLNRSSAEGVAGLKSFLEYAEKGRDALSYHAASEADSNDALLMKIADALRTRGYEIRTNIGCSGYRIDIGVVDPKDKTKYLLGILCDGYNYNAARTARDREITQTGVLEMLGWRQCRVWAMDWWENPTRTIESLVKIIEDAKTGTPEHKDFMTEEPVLKRFDPLPIQKDVSEKIPMGKGLPDENSFVRVYRKASLAADYLSAGDFVQGYYDTKIMRRIREVVTIEAPISKSLLCKRVLNSFGISRMGVRLSSHLDRVLERMKLKTSNSGNLFYWNENQEPHKYNIYRPGSDRDALDIAPEEMAVAVCQVLAEQGALSEPDLLREAARLFNYTRMGDHVLASALQGVRKAIECGKAVRSDGRIRLV